MLNHTNRETNIPGTEKWLFFLNYFWHPTLVRPARKRLFCLKAKDGLIIKSRNLLYVDVVVGVVVCRLFYHFWLVWDSRAFRPRISPFVRKCGYRNGKSGALPQRGYTLVRARAKLGFFGVANSFFVVIRKCNIIFLLAWTFECIRYIILADGSPSRCVWTVYQDNLCY